MPFAIDEAEAVAVAPPACAECQQRSKTCGSTSGAMPVPVSATENARRRAAAGAPPCSSTRSAGGRELDRVGEQVRRAPGGRAPGRTQQRDARARRSTPSIDALLQRAAARTSRGLRRDQLVRGVRSGARARASRRRCSPASSRSREQPVHARHGAADDLGVLARLRGVAPRSAASRCSSSAAVLIAAQRRAQVVADDGEHLFARARGALALPRAAARPPRRARARRAAPAWRSCETVSCASTRASSSFAENGLTR